MGKPLLTHEISPKRSSRSSRAVLMSPQLSSARELLSPTRGSNSPSSFGESEQEIAPDAFTHETDALDYCDEELLERFLYDEFLSSPPKEGTLEPCMCEYHRAAITPGTRLEEWAFEDMNDLPRDFMKQLRPYCEIRADVPQWTKLDVANSVYLIVAGAVSVVQMLPQAEEVGMLQPAHTGFSFRQGKRLHRRIGPGYMVGDGEFFLRQRNKLSSKVPFSNDDLLAIVSSKPGPTAELWVLSSDARERLPQQLKTHLIEAMCVQMEESALHSRLKER